MTRARGLWATRPVWVALILFGLWKPALAQDPTIEGRDRFQAIQLWYETKSYYQTRTLPDELEFNRKSRELARWYTLIMGRIELRDLMTSFRRSARGHHRPSEPGADPRRGDPGAVRGLVPGESGREPELLERGSPVANFLAEATVFIEVLSNEGFLFEAPTARARIRFDVPERLLRAQASWGREQASLGMETAISGLQTGIGRWLPPAGKTFVAFRGHLELLLGTVSSAEVNVTHGNWVMALSRQTGPVLARLEQTGSFRGAGGQKLARVDVSLVF